MIAGRYVAKIKDYGISETKAGLPMVMVLFGFRDAEEKDQQLIWFGSLKEGKAREITIDALLICGMKDNNLENMAAGNGSGFLDQNKEISIEIGQEEYNGKTRMKVKYINEMGGAGFREKMDKGEAVQKLSGMNLTADIMARRMEKGTPATTTKPVQPSLTDADIPF